MKEQRFACTTCGQCCFGSVPLTLDDALANAGRFPLAMVWTPVRTSSKSFHLTEKLGATVRLPARKRVAVLIAPTAYIPPSFPCPALSPENLCAIHEAKPLRCRTMPFFPYREENDQLDQLVPRKGWRCDTSENAPVVYRDKAIVDRTDYDIERRQLMVDAPLLRAYAETTLKQNPSILNHLMKAAMTPVAGRTILNFATFLRLNKNYDFVAFVKQQHPVLKEFECRTAESPDLAAYHAHYRQSAEELAWFANRANI
jgi:Fe-S-cluster containining protein